MPVDTTFKWDAKCDDKEEIHYYDAGESKCYCGKVVVIAAPLACGVAEK